jgi:general secretion pathway protein K
MKLCAELEPGWNHGRSKRGSALLVVLFLLGAIAALAAVISRSVSGAAIEMSAAQLAARQEADLRAGIELGAVTILRLGADMRSAEASVNLPDRRIQVLVTNERARIDLNAASPAVLRALLSANGVSESDAADLAQSVVEWRGGSASQRLAAPVTDDQRWSGFAAPAGTGVRPEAELRKPPKPIPGTRFFLHPMQLASVPGFSQPLAARLLPLVTVANGTNQLDPYIASRDVLLALPGVSEAAVDAFLRAREGTSGGELALRLLGAPEALVTSSAAAGWRVEIASVSPTGRTWRAEAVIAVLDGDNQPYRVLYVVDRP